MMLDLAAMTERLRDGPRLSHRSPHLCVATGTPGQLQPLVDSVGAPGDTAVRYYLSAGTGRFGRPPWGFRHRGAPTDAPRLDWTLVERILHCRENRNVAVERELGIVDLSADRAPTAIVMELLGTPRRDDVVFLQACLLRVASRPPGRAGVLVVRHAPQEQQPGDLPPAGPADEVLLALLLAGGHAWESELRHWTALRGWDRDVVAALTAHRATEHGNLYTYTGSGHWARAAAVYANAEPVWLGEVAAMVASTQPEPLMATAQLVADPDAALAAVTGLDHDGEAGLNDVLAYGRRLFHEGRRRKWTGVSNRAAGTLMLAAFVARGQAVSAATVPALLNLAERFGLDADTRSGLAYTLGQWLARGNDTLSWDASLRCFRYARECVLAHPSADPVRDQSRLSAAHNGTALALFRRGDRSGALLAEHAGLDALSAPGILDAGHLREQEILLLTNAAKVLRTGAAAQALETYRQAWQLACAAESVGGMAYVGPDLVRSLLADGRPDEAQVVVEEFLRLYDRTADISRNVERAMVTVCCLLAETDRNEATMWYLRGVRRMRHGAPRMVAAIIDNLRLRPTPPATLAELERELTRHRALERDLTALSDLLDGSTNHD
jgi:hypothetical protein